MKKDPYVLIEHIRESITTIESYTLGISGKEFLNTPQIQDAVIRRLGIIGEAASKLDPEFTKSILIMYGIR